MDIKELQEPTSLKELLQGMAPEALAIVRGQVISASPLKIQVINDEKLILEKNIICLPRHLSTYQTTVDISLGKGSINSITRTGQGEHEHPGITESGEHSHNVATFNITGASMTVYNGLKPGDLVYILSFNHGKKYYILDREA